MASSACLDPDTAASYAANALEPGERARVEEHIDGCPTCRELVSLIAKSAWTTGALGTATVASPSRPSGPAVEAAVLPRGTRIGPFEIKHPLSAGGMGVVYVGYDARLDRQVALKGVRERLGDSEQLMNEARLMAQASHPNVVPVYDVIDAHGQLFIAMELVVGCTVRQWLQEGDRGWREIVDVFLEAGRGLAAAHALGVIHGDVKPANILIGDDGRVRVTDFGIASRVADPGDGLVLRGTPGYFAPEQLAGKQADVVSDQYAFAVSLHEALYGALPGSAPTRRVSIPGAVGRVIARASAREPAARFPSMDAMLRALRAARLARWRWVAGAAATTVALAILAFSAGGRRAQAEQCDAAAAELEAPWDAASRQRAREAFSRTGLSYAAETLQRVEANLDAWQQAHDAAKRSACAPGWLSREVPLQRLTGQLACLKESTREAKALITQLTDADTAVVLRAVAASQQLSPLERCSAPVASRAVSAAHPELRDRLAKARALAAAGKYRDALDVGAAAAKEAEAANDPALLAAAKELHGGCLFLVGRYDEAAATLGDAIRLAELAQEDRPRALAWSNLLAVEYARGHHDQVLLLGGAALGAAQRIDDVRLVSEAMLTIGSSLSEKGRAAEARAMLEQAVKLRSEAWGDKDRRTSAALSVLANAMAMGGDLEGAKAAHGRALVAAEEAFGPAHPEVAIIRMNWGDDYLYGLEADVAAEQLARAVATLTAANGDENREVLMATTDLGFAFLLAGKPETALAAFERAVAKWAAVFPEHPVHAMALLGRYQALEKLRRPADVADLEKALTFIGDLPPFEAGRVQLQLGLATKDPKLVAAAKENLSTTPMPLIAAELKRADAWLARR